MGNHTKSDSPNYLKTTIKFNRAINKATLFKIYNNNLVDLKPSLKKVEFTL